LCDGSTVQFVRVPTTRAIGLIFLLGLQALARGTADQLAPAHAQALGHVSVEHGCSGIGTPNIYEYLCGAQAKTLQMKL
jgi:hypothetical protein